MIDPKTGKVVVGKLRELKITELSGVDRPANPGARIVLFKRDVEKRYARNDDLPAGVKDALPDAAQTVFREAFNRAFDEGAKEESAFAQAWTAVKNGWEQDAEANWMRKKTNKRAIGLGLIKIAKAMDGEGAKSFDEIFQCQELNDDLWKLTSALQGSIQSVYNDGSLDAETKQAQIAISVGQFIAELRARVPEKEAELEKLLSENPATAGFFIAGSSGSNLSGKEGSMPDDANVKKQLEQLQGQVGDLTTKLAKSEAIAKMSDAEKEYMASLPEADREKFAGLSGEDRAKAMKDKPMAKRDDEALVVDGQTIRKSEVGPAAFAVMKSQQAAISKQATDLARAEEARELAEFTKRAETEFSHLPGDPAAKGKALRALSKLAEDDRKTIEAMLKGGDAALAKGMGELGHGRSEAKADADAAFNTRVAEIQKRDSCSRSQAMEKAAKEFPDEYKAYQGEQPKAA